MVRKLEADDFRAIRMVLEPDDFALTDGEPQPPPSDLVDSEVWHGIMDIADDVAVRTTSHQGSRIEVLYEIWGEWIEALPNGGVLSYAMLECSEDFAASMFTLLHGFYRQSIGTLRSALEITVFACLCRVTNDLQKWKEFEDGRAEIEFGKCRHALRQVSSIKALEERARSVTRRTLFADRNGADPGGWVTSLYSRLSQYIHAGGTTSNGSMWESNGPVYSAQGMKAAYHCYLETYALLLLLVNIADKTVEIPGKVRYLFSYDSRRRYLPVEFRKLCRFIERDVSQRLA